MKKEHVKRCRVDSETDMLIRELAEMMGVSQSAVIRVLIKHSLNKLQDEEGFLLSDKISKLENDSQEAT
ncbi:ribbon-helix-helix protein, CopG family [Proteiniphilum sp. UBA5463]|jgi:hypothetical protein|uniref:ribbon-helix-helix protein, CopG family n=1 Tax=Proteiniphilum sp. UBA5463 TaxID=1947281 RepID=UPI00257A1376|nr:ribbon-helix-helix protein, CopG family [Proteiniphilum sp. UBA5463]